MVSQTHGRKSQGNENRWKLALATSVALSAVGYASAGTVTFSGRTWDTYDQFATAQYSPGQWNEYFTTSNNSGSMLGRFGVDTIIKTAMTVNVGDKISYDYVLTNNTVDLGNDGGSQWIGDNYASFRPNLDFYPSSKVTGHTGYYWYRDLWFSDPFDGGWTNAGTNNNATGVHFEWSFPTSSTYVVNVWNGTGNPSGAPVATYSSSLNGGASAIQAFRLSLWDSEQTVSVSNFKSRPTVPAQSGNTRNWIALSSGNYNSGANWLGGSAPTLADHATIANGGTAIVNGSGASAARVVTLAIGGATGSGTVEVQSGGELFSANSIRLGTATGTGTLNQSGGLVAIDLAGDQNLRIGHDAGGTGYYNLSGGELWVGDSLTIGKDGAGTLNMAGGWISHAGFMTVGRTAGSNGTFNMSGGVVDQTFGDLEIGNFSTGTANLSGGTFNGAPGRAIGIGNRLGGTGIATISGSALVRTEDLFIAGNDNTVTSLGGTGTLNINGGELQINDDFIVGNYGNGTLSMTGGLVSKSGWIVLGNNPGSNGTMNMSGGTINQTFGDLEIGDEATGTANFSGGTFNGSWGFFVGNRVGGNGTATINGTALVKANNFVIGREGTGQLNIDGGEAQIADDFIIGHKNTGTVTMTGGLVSQSGWIVLGDEPGASGTLNMSGGTINQSFGDLEIGDAGTGTLNLSGGSLNITGTIFTSKQAGGNGDANISGGTLTAQSTVNNGTFDSTGGTANLGPVSGTGAMTVGGTGVVNASHVRLPWLTINNGGTVNTAANGTPTGISVIDNLTINSGGALNLADNDLVVNNGSFTDIQAKVLEGFGGATGITSSTSDGNEILAVFDNALVGATEWEGLAIGPNAIVGKYTYLGDLNLDGQVSGDDYGVIDANLDTTPAVGRGWIDGDANLDGMVTGDDYGVIDARLGLGEGNPLSASAVTVPEPALLGLLAALGIGVLSRRRRRN